MGLVYRRALQRERKASTMGPLGLSREDVEAVQRLRQLYPSHVLASLFDEGNTSLLSRKSDHDAYSQFLKHFTDSSSNSGVCVLFLERLCTIFDIFEPQKSQSKHWRIIHIVRASNNQRARSISSSFCRPVVQGTFSLYCPWSTSRTHSKRFRLCTSRSCFEHTIASPAKHCRSTDLFLCALWPWL